MDEKTVVEAMKLLGGEQIPEAVRKWGFAVETALKSLAREKADAVQPQPLSGIDYQALKERIRVAESALSSAICRAEAAEKERDAEGAKNIAVRNILGFEGGWQELPDAVAAVMKRSTANADARRLAEQERDEAKAGSNRWADAHVAACSDAHAARVERDALRADCAGLSKLHEQDKAELARWRNAAGELRDLFGADKPMGSPHYYAEDFVRLHLRATLKDAEKP